MIDNTRSYWRCLDCNYRVENISGNPMLVCPNCKSCKFTIEEIIITKEMNRFAAAIPNN